MDINELRNRYNLGENFDYNFFHFGKLSNWHPSVFALHGVEYWCNEQYMMAQKAKLFNDMESYNQIMKSKKQAEMQDIGRRIKNFEQYIWDTNKENIVFDGAFAKFTQDENLKEYMLSQKDKILVEASRSDTIWGIGLTTKDKGIYNPNMWKGKNLLGFILMDVRDEILS